MNTVLDLSSRHPFTLYFFFEGTPKTYHSFIEERKIFTRDYTVGRRPSQDPSTKPSTHPTATLLLTPNGYSGGSRSRPHCQIKSTVPPTFLRSLRPKTLPLHCFHRFQQIEMTTESKPFLSLFGTCFLAASHQASMVEWCVGQRSILMFILRKQLYHTCLANTHCIVI